MKRKIGKKYVFILGIMFLSIFISILLVKLRGDKQVSIVDDNVIKIIDDETNEAPNDNEVHIITVKNEEPLESYSVKIGEYDFEVVSANISKKCNFEEMAKIDNDDIVVVEKTITSKHCFVEIDLKIKNNLNKDKEFGINNHELKIFHEGDLLKEYKLYMINENQNIITSPQYFHVFISSREEKIIKLLYIIDEMYLEGKEELILSLDPFGHDGMRVAAKDVDGNSLNVDFSSDVAKIRINSLLKEN